jgi:hypothetical protein
MSSKLGPLMALLLIVPTGCKMQVTSVGDNGEQSMRLEVPITMLVGTVELTPGEQNEIAQTFNIPVEMQFNSITVDMAATFGSTEFTRDPNATARRLGPPVATREVFYRVGPASEGDNVCQTGTMYGPFMVSVDANAEPMGVDPPSSEIESDDVEVINSGAFAICVIATPMNSSALQVNMLALDVTMGGNNGECGEPENLAGTWTGNYLCTYSCGSAFGGDISFTITQDGNEATYFADSDTIYSGTVCGNVFSFSRDNSPGESETGTFTLNADGTGTKESHYEETGFPFCSGDCTDNLTRQEESKSASP